MCFPAMLGGLVSAIGSVVSAAGAKQQADSQSAIYKQQAATERMTAKYNSERQNDKSIKLINTQRAAFLTAGVSPGYGSAFDVGKDTTREATLDVEAIKWNGELKAQHYDMLAQAEKLKGDNAMAGGLIGALSPLLKGGGGGAGGGGDGGGGGYGGTNFDYASPDFG